MDEGRAAALTQTLGAMRGVTRAGAAERAELSALLAARRGAAREHGQKAQAQRKSEAKGSRLSRAVKLPPPADLVTISETISEPSPPVEPVPAEPVPAASAPGPEAEETQSLKDFLGADPRRADFLINNKK